MSNAATSTRARGRSNSRPRRTNNNKSGGTQIYVTPMAPPAPVRPSRSPGRYRSPSRGRSSSRGQLFPGYIDGYNAIATPRYGQPIQWEPHQPTFRTRRGKTPTRRTRSRPAQKPTGPVKTNGGKWLSFYHEHGDTKQLVAKLWLATNKQSVAEAGVVKLFAAYGLTTKDSGTALVDLLGGAVGKPTEEPIAPEAAAKRALEHAAQHKPSKPDAADDDFDEDGNPKPGPSKETAKR